MQQQRRRRWRTCKCVSVVSSTEDLAPHASRITKLAACSMYCNRHICFRNVLLIFPRAPLVVVFAWGGESRQPMGTVHREVQGRALTACERVRHQGIHLRVALDG